MSTRLDHWMETHVGTKCENCGKTYRACTKALLEKSRVCCAPCNHHDTHNVHRKMSEANFTNTVIEMAMTFGWRVAHFRPAETKKGWRTAMTGHIGFPDLVLARHEQVMFVELKSDTGKMRPDQEAWAKAIGPNFQVWRPGDLKKIERLLR